MDANIHPADDGSLVADLAAPTRLPYDCANRRALIQVDGCGGLSRYALAGFGPVLEPDSFYSTLSSDGLAWPWSATKRLTMFGRRQRLVTEADGLTVICDSFLDEAGSAVYQEFALFNRRPLDTVFGLDFGFIVDAAAFGAAAPATSGADPSPEPGSTEPGSAASALGQAAFGLGGGRSLVVAADAALKLREREGRGYHLSLRRSLPSGASARLRLAYRLNLAGEAMSEAELLAGFDAAEADAKRHESFLRERMKGSDSMERALHASALNCAISSYKDVNGFKGFFAGVDYQTPLRTYYRDGYFTALPLLAHRPDLVRNQLLTLASGIDASGRCPSAVIDAGNVFWPDHIDSPAFFVMLLHDYVAATGEPGVLRETVGGDSLVSLALRCVDGLASRADAMGLIFRAPADRHDWADNVFREGYVTYIQVLYYRALVCAGRLVRAATDADPNPSRAADYAGEAERVRRAINQSLWDDGLGWYVDYRSETHTEDHLAIDTVLAAVFGVAGPDRSRRLLAAMEQRLETRSNKGQPFGDWGTMCCYPPYRFPGHLVEKSSRPFSYHNGSDWPYWSCMYAFAKGANGLNPSYPLRRWFAYSLAAGWSTPVEYYSPAVGRGSALQAWSSMAAFVIDFAGAAGFPYQLSTDLPESDL